MSTRAIQLAVQSILQTCYGAVVPASPIVRSRNLVLGFTIDGHGKVMKLYPRQSNAAVKELMLVDLVGKRGVPVATIDHADPEGKIAGRPFIIMETAGPKTLAEMRLANAAGSGLLDHYREMGEILLRIHAVKMPRAGEISGRKIEPGDPRGFVEGLIEVGRLLVSRGLIPVHDLDTFSTAQLPSTEGRSLCHSDYREAQCVIDSHRISAVLDWESAWSGNALIDFAIARTHLELLGEQRIVEAFANGYLAGRTLVADFDDEYRVVFMATVLGLFRAWISQRIDLDDARMRPRLESAARCFHRYANL